MRFGDYWLQTGTPSMFVELFRNNGYYLNKLDNEEATADMLDDVDSMQTNPISVVYQSGYLTISGFDKETNAYKLTFPNREVETRINNVSDRLSTLPAKVWCSRHLTSSPISITSKLFVERPPG
jgi:hypothetical protein